MSNPWDRPGRVDQLITDVDDLALAYQIGSAGLTDEQAYRLLCAAARLAGAASLELPPWPMAGDA